ncbi:MAG: LuxR C-terminal-related transcriptional regulator, partial [Chloroflexota bacterium]
NDSFLFFVENAPANLHLVLLSRSDPAWPLAKFRARNQLAEIRAQNLRFTESETDAFLNKVMLLGLSPDQIAVLNQRTEGWIAGLQMAAISLKSTPQRSALVDSFGASNRFVLDFLLEEVLEQQSESIRQFLCQTSILDLLTPPLCDAITQRNDSQQVLVDLDRANLFLIPLDTERFRYRYHHLFRDMLRQRMQVADKEQVPLLHTRASEWYEQAGLIPEAVTHAMQAENNELVDRLVSGNALALINSRQLGTLADWIMTIPSDMYRARPWISIAYAWALAFAGRFDDATRHIEQLEIDLDQPIDVPDEIRHVIQDDKNHIRAYIAALNAWALSFSDDMESIIEVAQQAVEQLPNSDLRSRAMTETMMGVGYRGLGHYDRAREHFAHAVQIAKESGDVPLTVDLMWESCRTDTNTGNLSSVMDCCNQALAMAAGYKARSGRRVPSTGYTYAEMSKVHLARNQIEEAYQAAHTAYDLCERWGQVDARYIAHMAWINANLAKGFDDKAFQLIESLKSMADELGPWYRDTAQQLELETRLETGNLNHVQEWASREELDPQDEIELSNSRLYMIYADLLYRQGNLRSARQVISNLVPLVDQLTLMRSKLRILILQALLYWAESNEMGALDIAATAIEMAQEEDYLRPFVLAGEPLLPLLQRFIEGQFTDFVQKVIAAIDQSVVTPQTAIMDANLALIEPLSDRELEVLQYLNSSLNTREIANELYIAVTTVRSHVKSIYEKLGVHSRTDAVARARELKLMR